MNLRDASLLVWFASAVACSLGCQAAGDAESQAPQAAADSPAANAADVSQPVAAEASTKPAKEPTPSKTVEPTATAQFTPPFPDRVELFEPPKRAQSTVRHDEEGGDTVELKGFINVDQPRVVLSIDGVISPIPEGGEKYGVQVISIQPPSVVLQRGRSRWTATLE